MASIDDSENVGGRVTRSLRKRLTSVDTDSSSRPGTPVLSSLQTVQESAMTPSKRTTRRTSMSTPVPTPSKARNRLDVPEVASSPARRSTRRRSTSTHEQGEAFSTTKMKEPAFDAVKEEGTADKSPESKPHRVSPRIATRSASERSRSETPNMNKSGTSDEMHISPEVSPKVLKHMKQTKVMLKKEHMDEGSITPKESSGKKKPSSKSATPQRSSPELKKSSPEPQRNSPAPQINTRAPQPPQRSSPVPQRNSPAPQRNSPAHQRNSPAPQINSRAPQTPQRSSPVPQRNSPAPQRNSPEHQRSSPAYQRNSPAPQINSRAPQTPQRSSPVPQRNSPALQKNSPTTSDQRSENETTLIAPEAAQYSLVVKKRGRPSKIKNVGFNNTADEDVSKSVFPKTPGLTKSKSYILDSSKPEAEESTNKSVTKSEESHVEDAIEEENEVLNTKTPYKLKLNSVESSTPIQSASAKKEKDESDQKDTSSKDGEGSKEGFTFPKSWSHSVSGTVNDLAKIDSIESEEISQKKLEEEKAIKKNTTKSKSLKRNRSLRIDSDEDSEEDVIPLDDEEDVDEEEEENQRERSMFVDDEAMEVSEGEESMDSEERAYLEENEIPVYAESIGSEDTVEEECEEEADEEDAAFVVSDTEEILQVESDSDEEMKANKKYRRIVQNVDSSDDESAATKRKDADFCLLVDSSMDEASNGSTKDKSEKKSKAVSVNDEIKEVESENVDLAEEKSGSLSRKSVKSQSEEEACEKEEENENGDVASEEVKAKKQEETQIEVDKDVESKEEGELSKKERKSLMKRKSAASQEDHIDLTENLAEDKPSKKSLPTESEQIVEEVKVKERKSSLKLDDMETEANAETEGKPKDVSSKKDRFSLSLSKADRKSMITQDLEETPVNSPTKRKSFKNQKVRVEDVNRNEIEANDDKAEIASEESDVPSNSSMKERKSMKKLEADTVVGSPRKRKSIKSAEVDSAMAVEDVESESGDQNKSYDESQAEISASQKRKSLKSTQKEQLLEDQVTAMEDVESKSGELNTPSQEEEASNQTQSETMNSSRKSKKERKSLNKSQKKDDHNSADVEMADMEDEEQESDKTCMEESFKSTRKSLSKSSLGKQQNEVEGDEKDALNTSLITEDNEEETLAQNESLHQTGTDSDKEETPRVESDDENAVNSSVASGDTVYRISPLKPSRKSLNKTNSPEPAAEPEAESSLEKLHIENVEEDSLANTTLNKSQKALNTSKIKKRKSLKRTSAEKLSDETETPTKTNKVEKSHLSVGDDSETETTSALEVSSRILGSSRNSLNISRKSLNQSSSSKKTSTAKKSPRKSIKAIGPNFESEDENSEHSQNENESQEKNVSNMSEVNKFLGEEESQINSPNLNSTRRKSLNKSTLDETIHLEVQNSPRRDSLHRDVLKKSLNQSKVLSESMKIAEKNSDIENGDDADGDSDVSAQFSAEEEEVEIVNKVLPQKGLSVSLSGIECKKRTIKGEQELVHKSFTIGVSLRNADVHVEEENVHSSHESLPLDSSGSMSEKEDLENVENTRVAGPYKPRNSLSKIGADENGNKTKSKRYSLIASEGGASQSFVENLEEEKKKVESKRTRRSNSFHGVVAPCEEPDLKPEEEVESESKSFKKQTHTDESSKSETKHDIQRILSRCDEILEAANRAKREAKLNAKKVKVKKPKCVDKEEKGKEDEVHIPLVSKKELKRKEKMKKELAKALKHSTTVLKTIDPKLVKKCKIPEVKPEPVVAAEPAPNSSKRLPADFLDELQEVPKTKKKKIKQVESIPPSDKEHSKKNSDRNQVQSVRGLGLEKKKKKPVYETFETTAGTVVVEPVTTAKLRFQNGFRESPRTPVGFEVELQEVPKTKKKKIKQIESTPPSDKENSKRNSDRNQVQPVRGLGLEKKKKKRVHETFETTAGTVVVEPATPAKLRFQNGFRESPRTPVGWEIEDLDEEARERSRRKAKKLFATTGSFEKADEPQSNKLAQKKSKKPKYNIEEPVYALPKTQWTSSGVFVEEDVYTVHHPLANSTATQFMVAPLGGNKKSKSGKIVSPATLSTALSFKERSLFNEKVKREPARNLLHRKERKLVNNRY